MYLKIFFHPRTCLESRRQGQRARDRDRYISLWERNISQLHPICIPTEDWTCLSKSFFLNWECIGPDMCPDQELNQQLFGTQADAQPTEPLMILYIREGVSMSYLPHKLWVPWGQVSFHTYVPIYEKYFAATLSTYWQPSFSFYGERQKQIQKQICLKTPV